MTPNFRDTLLLGFALFAMFFGAGNLIFPPAIGLASGTNWLTALLGFSITGIVLPLMGVIAILNAEGRFEVLTKPISPWFYKVFNLAVMVGIGMFVTIPRMAATTHELGVQPLFPQIPAVVTILVYFAMNFYFAMDKTNVVDKIGKVLTPLLVIILLFIVGKGILNPIGAPKATELPNPFSHSFINAYQTGDVITGILLAPIFIAAIRGLGYKGTSSVRKMTINATIIAGLGLLVVYGGLLYIGATAVGQFPKDIDNTALLIGLVQQLLGNVGTTLLAVAIALACLTSSIGVTAVIAEFLSDLTKQKLSYRTWVMVICATGITVGSLGVGHIISYAMPIFLASYPIAIVIVVLGLFLKYLPNEGAFKGAAILTLVVSLVETVGIVGEVEGLNQLIALLPLSENGFSWLIPAILGFILGAFMDKSKAEELREVS
ncbi:branched-chain amino acid transport system II carrier protein [Ammoniphilus sp. YIM 78166]|uniref:branched-chain amino acid transport system II carrier protein n=1 Tax=Ammoniphilus sp. YIM 78166 TaxID=1644106 RepID=UPI00106F7422|nr:branched-chain amino acid transport system II carrier protein [Ammoniphilus sp. YIM 78166]